MLDTELQVLGLLAKQKADSCFYKGSNDDFVSWLFLVKNVFLCFLKNPDKIIKCALPQELKKKSP